MHHKTLLAILSTFTLSLCDARVMAADHYVDPVAGTDAGDGSAEHPWRTLESVIAAGLIETQSWETLPYAEGTPLVTAHAGAPIKAGDTVWLRSGYHGEIAITNAYNTTPITLAAQAGQTPTARFVHLRSVGGWIVRGLSVSPSYAAVYAPTTLVTVEDHDWTGPSSNVVIDHCELFSVADTSSWTLEDWNALPCDGIRIDGDDCTVRDTTLHNVDFGISVSGTDALITHNTVQGFAGDGMRGLGDRGTFEYNTIVGCYDVNDNHDDGFQSWSAGPDGIGSGEVTGVTLRGNTFINTADADQPFQGPLQGIGCFDGAYVDWVIENNVVIVDHYHGITLMGARNSRIVNNTVVDLNDTDPGPAWIMVSPHKDGWPSTGCVVRNNLTTALNVPDGQGVSVDGNIVFDDVDSHFVDFAGRDLHLRETSSAIDTALADLAPAFDLDGVSRPQGAAFDVGAYEFRVDEPGADTGSDGGADAGTEPPADASSADADDLGLPPMEDAAAGGDLGLEPTVDATDNDAAPTDLGSTPQADGSGAEPSSCSCAVIGTPTKQRSAPWVLTLLVLVILARRPGRP